MDDKQDKQEQHTEPDPVSETTPAHKESDLESHRAGESDGQAIGLPERVRRVEVDGREVYLVGTAHVSIESVEDVRRTVEAVGPDAICIELCEGRHKALTQKDTWEKMDIVKVVRERKSVFLLAQLVLMLFYRKLGRELGVEPGAEMLEGVRQAERTGAELVLADREIEITLKRVWGMLGFWQKLSLISQFLAGIFVREEIDQEKIEKMKQSDQLEEMLSEFGEKFPGIKERLIDERDVYLAQKIRKSPGQKIVAVVGAGHVPGIVEHVQQDEDIEELKRVPPPSKVLAAVKWIIPILIIGLIAFGFVRGGAEQGVNNLLIWVLANGILSAVGTIIALGHPLAVVTSFVAAPLTSLNPMIAAGFVAGLVQAWVRRPSVKDFQELTKLHFKQIWFNRVTRILLVVVFANLGSGIGTWIALAWIAGKLF